MFRDSQDVGMNIAILQRVSACSTTLYHNKVLMKQLLLNMSTLFIYGKNKVAHIVSKHVADFIWLMLRLILFFSGDTES
jgi:hypothetical protein